ncbi:ATP-grasp ribosomal peptide maturase [Nocardiopsis dassonvillei]|uniref:ATP-grasp ribosomal peptide maturase n=1 Tax=Nocardiopsis dassonvillei TaxID=2014 RepID=UPI003629A22C
MERTVLVVTALEDPTADLVITELHERGVPVTRLDPGDFPGTVRLSAEATGNGLGGRVHTPTRSLPLDGVRSVYWRRPSPYQAPPHLDAQDAQWAIDQARWGLGGVLASLPNALYVNHPWRNRDAESKPAQLAAAHACGFRVPLTLITNDLTEARQFTARHGPVVYKPLWRGDYRAGDGTGRTIWVRAVGPHELDESVAGTAHMFQARIDKEADWRATVVGDQVFCVRIDSEGGPLDWRADYDRLSYSVVTPPDGIVDAVRLFLRRFDLLFGCFDFAVAKDGTPYFLELNPNGQWSWINETRVGITAALADLLQKGQP